MNNCVERWILAAGTVRGDPASLQASLNPIEALALVNKMPEDAYFDSLDSVEKVDCMNSHRNVDRQARHIDYCLNLLGIRVWETSCQLIAKGDEQLGRFLARSAVFRLRSHMTKRL